MKSKVKAELEKLTERETIVSVEEPTSRCSRMVVTTKKSGKLRICIDPRPLNKALQREHYPLPVMEDMLPKLSNTRVFSKLDLSNAYWHVHLDKESSLLTTFQTQYGRYRWRRVPFGTSVSSELFQKHLTKPSKDSVVCLVYLTTSSSDPAWSMLLQTHHAVCCYSLGSSSTSVVQWS